jgi:hypothetical protein
MSNDDPFDTTLNTGIEVTVDPNREIDAVLDDLEALLKNGEVIAALTARGINASLALVAAGGLRAYVKGKKADAADDFATAAEEIRGRLAGAADVERGGSGGRRA